jgi:ribosomal protein S18 acetylase RimI-like enzyme
MTKPSGSATVSVRRAKVGDEAVISVLNADVQELHANAMPWLFKSPSAGAFPPEAAAVLLASEDSLVYLAYVDEAPVGYAYAQVRRLPDTPYRYAFDEIYLHHISVQPHYRGRGVGGALVDAVNQAAGDMNIKQVALDVWSFNEPALAFFRKHGFDTHNVRMWRR